MAGIAGLFGDTIGHDPVDHMLGKLVHRGPDSIHTASTRIGYAGVRASILSEARGNCLAQDADMTVLFDGEIYNPRREGKSDSDVVMDLYKKHGSSFPDYLMGVFACAIIKDDELILARDSVGVRPLYMGQDKAGNICFASELKALVGISDNVTEILPATTYSYKYGISGFVPRYPAIIIPDNPKQAAEALRECIMGPVERRIADSAVGACLLSGGLDSSIIAAAAKTLGADIPLITVGIDGAPDIENAKIMAEHLGMEHIVSTFSAKDIEDNVFRAVRTMESFDEDCISGTISNLFASSIASKYTNCILSGEGGDELFGGYHLLKDVPSQSAQHLMMKRLVQIAYNTAVQRLDRAMLANSINYRIPFIDMEVIAFADHLPVDWKIHDTGNGELVEKWLLREAFKDLLPDPIYRRRKLRFSGGTGTDGMMDEIASRYVKDDEFNDRTRKTPGGYYLSSPKELWYYRLFKQEFPENCFERLVGRWDPGK